MTVTASVPLHTNGWTVDDLAELDDDGNRYELIEGSLLVSPAPARRHFGIVSDLHRLLVGQAPAELVVGQNAGVMVKNRDTYFIPDLVVVKKTVLGKGEAAFRPSEVLLAVEVMSPRGRGIDLVTKRYYYAAMGIPRYWIVDPAARTLTVLVLEGEKYTDDPVVEAGRLWRTDQPFPLELDPADLC